MILALALTRRQRVERAIGRLPRNIAYPLIMLLSVVLWSAITIAAVSVAEWIAAWLR